MVFDLKNVRRDRPSGSEVCVFWLGGAGYVFKFSDGQILCVDPYLSDSCERISQGEFRRLSLAPLKPKELAFDLLLLTHDHGDHMDVDAFDGLLATNPGCRILAPTCCGSFLDAKNASYEVIEPGTVSTAGEITIETVDADHGELCAEAVGLVIRFSGRSIYLIGDTAYTQTVVDKAVAIRPDILIACINGAYGNLNEEQAATFAAKSRAKQVIPTHFGLFVEHGGCPCRFGELLKKISPQSELIVLTPGRGTVL